MSVFRHEIYCVNESAWVSGYGVAAPTVCYNNNAHTVGSVRAFQEEFGSTIVRTDKTHAKPGQVPVNGNLKRLIAIRLRDDGNVPTNYDLAANSTSSMIWTSPPYPIYVMDLYSQVTAANVGDTINLYIDKDKYIGPVAGDLQGDVSVGATVLSVHPAIVAALFAGVEVSLDDGTNVDNVGEIIDVDTANAKIKVSVATTNAFSAATPTKVLFTSHPVVDLYLGAEAELNLGRFYDDASRIEPNTQVTVEYTNAHATQVKDMTVYMSMKHGSQNISVPL